MVKFPTGDEIIERLDQLDLVTPVTGRVQVDGSSDSLAALAMIDVVKDDLHALCLHIATLIQSWDSGVINCQVSLPHRDGDRVALQVIASLASLDKTSIKIDAADADAVGRRLEDELVGLLVPNLRLG